jgi:hypothetical protein
MTYSLTFISPSSTTTFLPLADQNITSYSLDNLQIGTSTYLFMSSVSSIPISGLTTSSYSGMINDCLPGNFIYLLILIYFELLLNCRPT